MENSDLTGSQIRDDSRTIYLVSEDEQLANHAMEHLTAENIRISQFTTLAELEGALQSELPHHLLVSTQCCEGKQKGNEKDKDKDKESGFECIERLRKQHANFPPVTFISKKSSFEERLAAVRAGASDYLSLPQDQDKLLTILDNVNGKNQTSTYKILVISTTENAFVYYESLLKNAGMKLRSILDPLKSTAVIEEFQPDLIIIDVHTPALSGFDLAKAIRQLDSSSQTPIILSSSDNDHELRIQALNNGGIELLVKPLDPDYLVATISAKVEDKRRANNLTQKLQMSLMTSDFHLITMGQHNLVSTTNLSGKIVEVNDKFCEISQYTRAELLGKNHRILKSSRHPASFYKELWKTISEGEVWQGTICNRKKNGSEYWVESTIVPFLDDKGLPYKYVSARTDITTLRISEERLKQSQKFANIGTWDSDLSKRELFWSEGANNILGFEKNNTKTKFSDFLQIIHPDDKQALLTAIDNCIQHHVELDMEHRIIWQDGSIHWVHESGNTMRNANGEAIRVLGIVRDITDDKVREKNLIEARAEAENANQSKSEFLSSMSHELRTPMNAILGFSQLMMTDPDDPLPPAQLDNVSEILKAGSHLLELINEVLDFATIESGQLNLSLGKVALTTILSEVLLLIAPLARNRGVSIELKLNREIVSIEQLHSENEPVLADRTRLKQVFLNLLSNAVKYNKKGGNILLTCTQVGEEFTKVSIKDTGSGLSEQQLSELFIPFKRLGLDQSTTTEGTGIGLVITKKLIEAMGGNIGVTSEPGAGCEFWVTIPRFNNKVETTKWKGLHNDTFESNVIPNADPTKKSEDKRYSVLYIEDNPANLRLVNQILARIPSIHSWSAHEPMLGLELAEQHNPDLILLDINLPGMDGFSVLKRLKESRQTQNTPIIAISANAMPADIEIALGAGFDDYITKPINVEILVKAVTEKLFNKE